MSETLGITKKELAEQYDISWRTVYRTLQLCKLDTSKLRYSKDEALLFRLARTLLKDGWTARQVAELLKNKGVLEGLKHFQQQTQSTQSNK